MTQKEDFWHKLIKREEIITSEDTEITEFI